MSFLVIVIISALVFSAFFSGMEIAFVSANRLRIELDKKHKKFPSGIVSIFINKPTMYITAMLMGNNVALVIYGIYMERMLDPFFTSFVGSDIGIYLLQILISTIVILIFAEFIPKAVFRLKPNSFLNVFALPVYLFYLISYPVNALINSLSGFLLKKLFKQDIKLKESQVFNKIDLTNLIKEESSPTNLGQEDNSQLKLFQNALNFSKVKLRDCMVPRTEISAIELNSDLNELKQKFIETRYSKILVYNETIDDIIGYVSSKEYFKNPRKIEDFIIQVSFYPETMSANKLLQNFIKDKKNIAIVVDEFGGTSGIVTIEDIIEEIFGEIEDEHDEAELVHKKLNDTAYLLSGRLEIDFINELYNLDITTSDDYDTVAGLILHHNENIPATNEDILIDNFHFKVLKVTKTKLELVKLDIIK